MPKVKAPKEVETIEAPSKPTAEKIAEVLARLRSICDDAARNPYEQRMAQAQETAIRWATEETSGWPDPDEDALLMAQILKADIALAHYAATLATIRTPPLDNPQPLCDTGTK